MTRKHLLPAAGLLLGLALYPLTTIPAEAQILRGGIGSTDLGPGSGTVTSVALAVPAASLFGVLGSPVIDNGTLGLTTTGISGAVPFFSSTSQLSSSALLGASQLVLGGGAGAAPATLGSLGTTTTVLHGNASGPPSFGKVDLSTDVTGILPGSRVTPGGVSGQIQWNNASAFDGLDVGTGLDFDTTAKVLNLTSVSNDQTAAADGNYTVLAGDAQKTVLVAGGGTTTLPQAGTTGFASGWSPCILNAGGSSTTLSTTTSLFKGAGGATTLTLRAGDWACPTSDDTNYQTLVGHNYLGMTAGLPIIGGGAGLPLTQGTRSGTGTEYATSTGSKTSGHIVAWDASGNAIDGGVAAGSIGGGSVTQVNTGTGLTGGPITTTGTVDLANTAVTPGTYTNTSLTVDQQGRLTAASSGAAPPSGANPTATAGDTAVNGSALTYMRSDAAPAVRKGSASQFGIVEVDGTTITASGGVITAAAGSSPPPSAANPTATAGPAAVNGSASTYMRSDAAPAVQQGSAAQKGIVQVDGTTIVASSGVISASGSALGSITLNAGSGVGLTAPGAMTLGSTYTIGATSDQPQFAGLGIGGAATGANRVSIFGATSGRLELKVPTAAGTNAITLPAGTTDFSATGGTSQVVKQTSAGGALTVARLLCADLSDAGAGCSGSGGAVTLNSYTTAGTFTWTKQSGVTMVCAVVYGGGGSGGSGTGGAAGTDRFGGSAGGGGGRAEGCFKASDLSATETVTVASGGGAVAGGSNAAGSTGGNGGPSSFKSVTYLNVYGGGPGAGGTNSSVNRSGGAGGGTGGQGGQGNTVSSSGGDPFVSAAGGIGVSTGGAGSFLGGNGSGSEFGGAGGGGFDTTATGNAGAGSLRGGRGGGGAGGIPSSNAERASGRGGGNGFGAASTGGGAAGAFSTGGAGGNGTDGDLFGGGLGGGGGGENQSGTGGTGGTGGLCGGGGGGGGGGTSTGGTSGAGGAGCVFVYQW